MDEITNEIKQKNQEIMQTIQQLQQIFSYFSKLAADNEDNPSENIISQALEKGSLSSFNFTGQVTDLSYFSQSDTMPLSAIKNIGDENIKEAVKQNFDKAAQQGLIELDGDNIRITAKVHQSTQFCQGCTGGSDSSISKINRKNGKCKHSRK